MCLSHTAPSLIAVEVSIDLAFPSMFLDSLELYLMKLKVPLFVFKYLTCKFAKDHRNITDRSSGI